MYVDYYIIAKLILFICLIIMTTITIDTPVKLKKTHFTSPLEAGEFFLKMAIQQAKKQSNKSQYQIAMEDLEAGRNIVTQEQLLAKLAQRWVTL